MSWWENSGQSDDWWTPKYIFDALGCSFDLDPAHPSQPTHVPCGHFYSERGLEQPYFGMVWMNPPFGGRNGLVPWLDKFYRHGNGIVLTPDRTSAPWWQDAARRAEAVLFINGKVKFERPDGSMGKSPSNGTTLFAAGNEGYTALRRAQANGLGLMLERVA